jgi:hypothetical protein
MGSARDPRLVELKRLQLALAAAIKQLDEFEARVFRSLQKTRSQVALTQSAMPGENSFAVQIAAGMAKFRQGVAEDQTPPPPLHKLGSFRQKASQ